ncbi:MAG: transcriptional repressor LexA [Gammaproteobacteria bacterium]|nr:transcriptional repressor LexA [Gammaproteobacteria bacterium]
MKTKLTRKQQEIYEYLCEHGVLFEYPPTLEELCHAVGLSSRGSMHKHIHALIEAGLVEPMDRKRRGIRLADGACGDYEYEYEYQYADVPFMGYIAAGQPIEAIENPEPMEVPSFLQGKGKNYVLQVKGDSMIEDGILDGDWVVIEQRDHARNGEIVVALVDDGEATLKRIEQQRGKVILHPANRKMKAMRYRPDQVRIQGVLVGQMRAY